jgi:bifunctional non-homologous end joining protein LigD
MKEPHTTMSLQKYKEKRDFSRTAEPGTGISHDSGQLRFVIQRHQATHLHYDLRLEMEGVMKSWAVPKGPSMNPGHKRLAMMVEDHPYDYQYFEGIIPEGNYGAGTVEIWDKGTYAHTGTRESRSGEKQLLQDLHKGEIKFRINGEKLKGEFVLVKTKSRGDNAWLLIKHRDEFAVDFDYSAEDFISPDSAIRKGGNKRRKAGKIRGKEDIPVELNMPDSAQKSDFPGFIEPMHARLVDKPFDDRDWIFELKWDGYRAVAVVSKGEARLFSRKGLLFKKYKEITDELGKLPFDAVIDGEVVILDEKGRPDFQYLQNYERNPERPLHYFAFDLLYYQGYNLLNVPLIERKQFLEKVLPVNDTIRFSEHFETVGRKVYDFSAKHDLEGIVGKLKQSSYMPGKRSSAWVKIKTIKTQEGIIFGYNEPKESRKFFGSLMLAAYDRGSLRFIGSSGGGFSFDMLKEIHKKLQPLTSDSPAVRIKVSGKEKITWVKPELVCEVTYAEWTDEGTLRQPVFRGMRPDKKPEDVIVEKEQATAKVIPDAEMGRRKKRSPKKAEIDRSLKEQVLTIDGIDLKITNPEKIWWPDEGYTKADLIEFYMKIADYILPYLKDKPESQNRFPDGIYGNSFYKKNMADDAPEWAKTFRHFSESTNEYINYLICNDKPSLVYMAQIGCIEINPWNSRIQHVDYPDWLVIDLDPSEKNTFDQVIETALAVKEVLDRAAIKGYPKTSGSSGMHIYIPLAARYTNEQARMFADFIAELTHELVPGFTTTERMLNRRGDKLYIDYLQNRRGQTLAAPYSVRPRPGATVSTPLRWSEVKPGMHFGDFTIKTILKRLEKTGDLFSGVLGTGIDMGKALELLS